MSEGNKVIIPREFSKSKEQIDKLKAKAKKDAPKDKKDMADLKREVEMTVHTISPYEGLCEMAHEMSFNPPATIEEHLQQGLDPDQVDKIRKQFNELTPPPQRWWFWFFLEHQGLMPDTTGFFNKLLWAASVMCAIAYSVDPMKDKGNLYLCVVLAVVVFATGCFSYYQEASSAAVMEGFKNMIPPMVSVIRGGKTISMPARELIPGDVVRVNSGEKMPADVRICTATNFKVDQSSLTGEPDAIKKKPTNDQENPLEATNLAFFGTLAAEGDATGFVVQTGDDTVMGRIAQLAAGGENPDTPISIEIHRFIMLISGLAIGLGVVFTTVMLTDEYFAPVEALVFGIGIIVANVPEGLLATVTVSLTLTAKRLAKKQVLVKQLEAVETLGSTTCICSDKTGTLTQNRMTVQHAYVNNKIIDIPTATEKWATTNPDGEVMSLKIQKANEDAPKTAPVDYAELQQNETWNKLYRYGILCNTGEFTTDDAKLPLLQRLCCNGNASDYAFIKMAEAIPEVTKLAPANNGFGVNGVRAKYEMAGGKEGEIPFNSSYKFMTTLRKMEDGDTVIMKGAAEQVFSRCDTMLIDGELVPIDDELQARFEDVYKTLGKMGERVLGFAYKAIGEAPADGWVGGNPQEANFPLGTACKESGRSDTSDALTYIGLMALIDPPRDAVPSSVKHCHTAGVKVVMVTGDHPVTAAAIAKTVNIMPDKPVSEIAEDEGCSVEEAHAKGRAIVCPGWELKDMSEEEIQQVLLYDQVVFARTSPAQKLIIVQAAQKIGHVVAVTGDGVNDSPALKAADIGCAMGIAGTDVSKEAADMILLSDDFSAIVDGIEEGRLIFDNLKKSIAYTLSSNIPEISPFLMFIIVQMPLSLTTILILCVDLGTDMVPAISLAYEKPESDIMLRPPRDSEVDRLVTDRLMCFAYLQIGVFQALAGFYTFFVVLHDYGFPMKDIPGANTDFFAYPTDGNKIVKQCPCGGGQKAVKGVKWDYHKFIQIKGGVEYDGTSATPGSLDMTDRDYSDLSQNEKDSCMSADLGAYLDDDRDQAHKMLSPNWPFGYGCPYGSIVPTKRCKFENWKPYDSACYKATEALRKGQTAAFISIVIVQWADLLICKTRLLSIADQGMQNTVMLFGLFQETFLCVILAYFIPSTVLQTSDVALVHWFPSLPFSIMIFLYDETRKFFIRKGRRDTPNEVSFVERYSYY